MRLKTFKKSPKWTRTLSKVFWLMVGMVGAVVGIGLEVEATRIKRVLVFGKERNEGVPESARVPHVDQFCWKKSFKKR
jgi:hypothetical protein